MLADYVLRAFALTIVVLLLAASLLGSEGAVTERVVTAARVASNDGWARRFAVLLSTARAPWSGLVAVLSAALALVLGASAGAAPARPRLRPPCRSTRSPRPSLARTAARPRADRRGHGRRLRPGRRRHRPKQPSRSARPARRASRQRTLRRHDDEVPASDRRQRDSLSGTCRRVDYHGRPSGPARCFAEVSGSRSSN